jgi:uncharacterized protein (TIGR02145 family)
MSRLTVRRVLLGFALMSSGVLQAQTACPNPYDGNGDGVVAIGDLLDLLGLFGDSDGDDDGTWDSLDLCTDSTACNFMANPTETCSYLDALGVCAGGCTGDSDDDGICDDQDTCEGALDACGVCNGPGPTEVIIVDITIQYDSVYAEAIDTWYVFEVGADTTFEFTCPPPPPPCGDPVAFGGYDYATVEIGDQCWFAENVQSLEYANGDPIPANLSDNQWGSTSTGATIIFGQEDGCSEDAPDIDACDPVVALAEYGRLYNWYAVNDSRSLCPEGWHVPTDSEFYALGSALGGYPVAGEKMKTTSGWNYNGQGTNTSGFSGPPGGKRSESSGYFSLAGENAFFWTSTPYASLARYRELKFNSNSLHSSYSDRGNGYSVRCLQDAP